MRGIFAGRKPGVLLLKINEPKETFMTDTPNEKTQPTEAAKEEKQPGFFGRIFQKLDDSMKQKAEAQSQEQSCCAGTDSKGNRCC